MCVLLLQKAADGSTSTTTAAAPLFLAGPSPPPLPPRRCCCCCYCCCVLPPLSPARVPKACCVCCCAQRCRAWILPQVFMSSILHPTSYMLLYVACIDGSVGSVRDIFLPLFFCCLCVFFVIRFSRTQQPATTAYRTSKYTGNLLHMGAFSHFPI